MQEDDAIDLHHRVALAKPAAVLAVGPEREHQFDEADRRLFEKPGPESRFREGLTGCLRSRSGAGDEHAIVALAQLFRSVCAERRILAGADVPQVSEHPHRLVVAEQRVNAAPRPRGLAFQPPQQIERPARVGTAIQDVTRLNEDGATAGPALAGVDEARYPQNRDEAVVCTVHVGHGDDAL